MQGKLKGNAIISLRVIGYSLTEYCLMKWRIIGRPELILYSEVASYEAIIQFSLSGVLLREGTAGG